jgi:hypothetical protein
MFRVSADFMGERDFQGGFDRADVDVALARIHSTFGRLVFLAGMDQSPADSKVERSASAREKRLFEDALNLTRQELVFAWFRMSLTAQTEEVAQYFAAQGGVQSSHIAELLHQWIEEKRYEKLVPPTASDQMRSLFCSDLKATLRLLRIRVGMSEGEIDQ